MWMCVRAERHGRTALSDVYEAQKEAIDALGKAGTTALPGFLQVMDKPPLPFDGAALIRVFVTAAGKNVEGNCMRGCSRT